MRHALVAIALVVALGTVGCRREKFASAYTYNKDQISQEQLLQDEQTLGRMGGVTRVTSRHNLDGSATLEVAVDEAHHMDVQRKLSSMGYIRGEH